jgi:hypothetical protein
MRGGGPNEGEESRMRDVAAPAGRGKMMLTAILIAANLLMLAAGIITIPRNFPRPEEKAPARVYSTEERPVLEDFLWYTQGVYYDGVPANAVQIEDFADIIGGWKGFIYFDPENQQDMRSMILFNVTISGSSNDLSLTADWYMAYFPEEGLSFDESEDEDMVFYGSWDGGLVATDQATIHFPQFYELNDKQYAIGRMDTLNDLPAYMALVRP